MIVAKIGGAFVSSPELPTIASALFERIRTPLVLVAGGGEAADLVRAWDDRLELAATAAHWLAIRAMSLQAELLARRLGREVRRGVAPWDVCDCWVLDPWQELMTAPNELPVGWHVTSDSIAAWAAKRVGARELVMVKAVGDDATTIAEASRRGWVDPFFSEAARGLSVRWMNPKPAPPRSGDF
jgi:aspartokinase-like uncharacterized kinase